MRDTNTQVVDFYNHIGLRPYRAFVMRKWLVE